MRTESVTEATAAPADREGVLRLVVSRGEEGIQLELLGPRQLPATHPLALPAQLRLDPELRGSYYMG